MERGELNPDLPHRAALRQLAKILFFFNNSCGQRLLSLLILNKWQNPIITRYCQCSTVTAAVVLVGNQIIASVKRGDQSAQVLSQTVSYRLNLNRGRLNSFFRPLNTLPDLQQPSTKVATTASAAAPPIRLSSTHIDINYPTDYPLLDGSTIHKT